LELTEAELMAPKVEKPAGLGHHGHTVQSSYQRSHSRSLKTLVGVG
jgi:hypothetical protein